MHSVSCDTRDPKSRKISGFSVKCQQKQTHYYHFLVAWEGVLAHMYSESFSFSVHALESIVLNLKHLIASSSISEAGVATCTLASICNRELDSSVTGIKLAFRGISIYLSKSWLVHAGGNLMPGWSHYSSLKQLKHFLDSPLQRYIRTSSSSTFVKGTENWVWCQ